MIPVKVNGEELLVPLKEARDGIMLRRDYSQKTEELAKDRKMVDWARDVQRAFDSDPIGTLQAFAQAYGVDFAQQNSKADAQPEVDPYEDWDPEVAQMARAFDKKLADITNHYEQKISRIESQTGQITQERLVHEAQAEVQQLKEQFTEAGLQFDELDVLKIAIDNEMPLAQAAYIYAGAQAVRGGLSRSEANMLAAQAADVSAQESENDRQRAKKRAASSATKKFDADVADVSADEFSTLTDLFNLEMARQ